MVGLIKKLRVQRDINNWNDQCKDAAVELLAHLSALWTFIEMKDMVISSNFYKEAHASQIFSILLLLNCDKEGNLGNNKFLKKIQN